MPVLLEALSVVIRAEALLHRFQGGWEAFVQGVPNRTLCADGHLARVGFLTAEEARDYCAELEAAGLLGLSESGEATDYAVVDQMRGHLAPCAWLELGLVTCVEAGRESGQVLAGRLKDAPYPEMGADDAAAKVVTPEGWTWGQSLTKGLTDSAAAQADALLAGVPDPGGRRDN